MRLTCWGVFITDMAALTNPGSYFILISSVFLVGTALYMIRIDRSWQTVVYGVLLLIGICFILLSIGDIRTAIGLGSPLENVFAEPPSISKIALSGTLISMAVAMFFLWFSHRTAQ
jgi:hypothetical protein